MSKLVMNDGISWVNQQLLEVINKWFLRGKSSKFVLKSGKLLKSKTPPLANVPVNRLVDASISIDSTARKIKNHFSITSYHNGTWE